jgi:hypothetical protein
MPRVNPDKLVECLLKIHTQLQIVWLECKNNELCDQIRKQMDYIELMVRTVEDAFSKISLHSIDVNSPVE